MSLNIGKYDQRGVNVSMMKKVPAIDEKSKDFELRLKTDNFLLHQRQSYHKSRVAVITDLVVFVQE